MRQACRTDPDGRMIRRFALAVILTFTATLVFAGEGAVGAVSSAPSRLVITKTDTNALIKRVPVNNGRLMIGHELQGVVWTPNNGDPPCDPMGRTMYAAHTWRTGNGTADDWVTLRRGDVIKVGGCEFKVFKKEKWSDNRSIGSLSRPDGPAEIALYACWPSDYDFAQVIFARKVKKPFG